jgi:hypothetical protein
MPVSSDLAPGGFDHGLAEVLGTARQRPSAVVGPLDQQQLAPGSVTEKQPDTGTVLALFAQCLEQVGFPVMNIPTSSARRSG